MAIDRQRLRWNGWGWIEAPDMLGENADQVWVWMGKALGVDPLPETPAMELADIELPDILLDAGTLADLERVTAPDRVKTDAFERALHARGRSYHDLLHLRAGCLDAAPDAVVYPESADEVLALVQLANDRGFALIPFGGGSSVVGGVNAMP
ncbi:MAG: FAD-binding oxidoreductase, partial [bacterium]|nr:FAD-binding oxidoreductase [bacterium]